MTSKYSVIDALEKKYAAGTDAASQAAAAAPAQDPAAQGGFNAQQIQQMIMEPWFRQRQWEQYGSPNANIGMNMAGTHPVGYLAGQTAYPGMPVPGWQY